MLWFNLIIVGSILTCSLYLCMKMHDTVVCIHDYVRKKHDLIGYQTIISDLKFGRTAMQIFEHKVQYNIGVVSSIYENVFTKVKPNQEFPR